MPTNCHEGNVTIFQIRNDGLSRFLFMGDWWALPTLLVLVLRFTLETFSKRSRNVL